MKVFNRRTWLSIAVFALWFAAPASAQENLDHGKTAAQLFASDCAICHKSINGLSKNAGPFGLDSFLRQHYTASRESAAAISAYIMALDKGGPAPAKRTRRTVKGADRAKAADKKPDQTKPGEIKSGDSKPGDAKPAEAKPTEAKPAEAKPAEAKSDDTKPAETKPAEAKADTKPSDAKPSDTKPSEPKAAESAKPDKAD